MTVEEQVQFLKDQGVWEDFLIEIADGNTSEPYGYFFSSIIDCIDWPTSRQGDNFWLSVYRQLYAFSSTGSQFTKYQLNIQQETMLTAMQQWKEEYKEWFV